MTKQDRIASLLAQGVPANQVAALVGVTAPYISQLLADEDFKAYLSELIQEKAEKEGTNIEHEERKHYRDTLAAAEHKVLTHILNTLVHATAREGAAILESIGKRRDIMDGTGKGILTATASQSSVGPDGVTTTRTVQLTLPDICVPELKMAGNNEIVAIGDRSTAPMPAQALRKILGADESDPTGGYVYEHATA